MPGKPPLRLGSDPGALEGYQEQLGYQSEPAQRLFSGPEFSLPAVSDPESNAPATPALAGSSPSPTETAGPSPTEEEKTPEPPAYRQSVARLARQYKKIRGLIEFALSEAEEEELTPGHPFAVRRNVSQWFEEQRLELVLLMQTHDADQRRSENGVAYFDARVKFPGGEAGYPSDPQKVDDGLVFAQSDAEGGWVPGTLRVELYNPERRKDSWIWNFLKQAVSDHISWHWKEWFNVTGAGADFPFLMGWNEMMSYRMFDLVQAVVAHPKLKRPSPKEPMVLAAINKLDDVDKMCLGDQDESHRFWDSVKQKNPIVWADLYNKYRV